MADPALDVPSESFSAGMTRSMTLIGTLDGTSSDREYLGARNLVADFDVAKFEGDLSARIDVVAFRALARSGI